MKQKGFTLVELIGVVIILGLLCVLAIPPILNAINSTKDDLSAVAKELVINASELYLNENTVSYPDVEGNIYCITVGNLIDKEYLSSPVLDPITKKEVSRDKYIKTSIHADMYDFEFVDTCEEVRKEGSSLITLLKKQYNENNKEGLLKDTEYYYKGNNLDVSNNYLWYEGFLWRVLSFSDETNTLKLISEETLVDIALSSENKIEYTTEALSINYSYPQNNHLNLMSTKKDLAFIDEGYYISSRVSKTWLNNKSIYDNSYINTWLNSTGDNGVFYKNISDSFKNNIVSNEFCIGVYTNPCNMKTDLSPVGLLNETEYSKAGGKNSFLVIYDAWRLGNPVDNNLVRTIYFDSSLSYPYPPVGKDINSETIKEVGIRPVLTIKDIDIAKGDGSENSPYQTSQVSKLTNNLRSGEYINIPKIDGTSQLTRVIGHEQGAIKVVQIDNIYTSMLPSDNLGIISQSFKDNQTPVWLANVLSQFDSQYLSDTTKDFNAGFYILGGNYNSVKIAKNNSRIGLQTIGELFSVNHTIVEKKWINGELDITYILTDEGHMNVCGTKNILGFGSPNENHEPNESAAPYKSMPCMNGGKDGIRLESGERAKPTLFIKEELKIVSGDGTKGNPYTLK